MGVVAVHGYPLPEGKSGQQAVDNLSKILETLGATKLGTFSIECETYHSSGLIINKTLNIFRNSDYPATCFALLDQGTCLVADTNFDNIMLNLSNIYQTKKSNKMESKGPKYQIGDFTIKIGSVSIGPSFRGILIEVEYGPCAVTAYCWDMLKEFMGSFMIPPRDPHQYLQGKMNEIFSPIDIVQQYNDHFNNLRRMPSSISSMGQPPTPQQQQMPTPGGTSDRSTPVGGPPSNQMSSNMNQQMPPAVAVGKQ